MATNAAAIAQQLLALNVDISDVLIDDPQTGPMWMTQLTVQTNVGLTFTWIMSPQNARDLGKNLRERAVEAMAKLVPARSSIIA